MSVAVLDRARGLIHADVDVLPHLDRAVSFLVDHRERFLTVWDGVALPSACIDGRPEAGGRASVEAIRLAGATLSMWVGALLAGDLGDPSVATSESALAHLDAFCADMRERGFPVATHSDNHSPADRCGCGAADALGVALEVLVHERAFISSVLGTWGLSVDYSSVVAHADTLRPFLSGQGLGLYEVLAAHSPQLPPLLCGDHREVLVLANTRDGYVVDRAGVEAYLAQRGIDGAQVFVVDVWAALQGCELLGLPREAGVACVAFNIAVALTLCGSRMRFVTLS